jgi:cell division transport system permease protein
MFTFAFQGTIRNFWLSFVTTTVFVLTLITINAVILLNVIAASAIQSVEDRVHVEIYFNPGTSPEIEQSVRGYLSGLTQVREVILIPAEQALADFKAAHANDPEVLAALEEIGANPLGDALRVSAYGPEDFPFILEAVDTPEFSPYIREKGTADYQDIVQSLTSLSQKVRVGGLILASFFAMIAVLIVFNTIRVAIYVHRDEIAVMKLVGAHDWFIRGPFFIEVIGYSAVATVVMAGILFSSLSLWDPYIRSFFTGVNLELQTFYLKNILLLFGSQFIGLAVLGVATTALAMRRYLKV